MIEPRRASTVFGDANDDRSSTEQLPLIKAAAGALDFGPVRRYARLRELLGNDGLLRQERHLEMNSRRIAG